MQIRSKRSTTTSSPTTNVDGSREIRVRAFRVGFIGAIGVLFALVLGGVVGQLSSLLVYVGMALFAALGLDPAVSWLQRRGLKRWGALVIVVAAVLGIVGARAATIVPIIVEQATNISQDFPTIVWNVQHSDFVAWLNSISPSKNAVSDAIKAASDWITTPQNLTNLGGGIVSAGVKIAGGLTGFTIVIILTLYFTASLDSMKRYAARMVPARLRPGFRDVSDEITQAVGRYVIGQAALGALNGILSLVFLSILGAPAPILLAFVAFLFSLLPLVGTLSGSIIISLVCLATSPQTALIAGIYYLVYMQVEAYIINPRIMAKAVAVPGALVVIAAVAGGTLGGIPGALVAIPVAASIVIVLERIVFPRQDAAI